ncbi:MAG: FliM/FliN family flagellar motor switch protein [Sedimentisphaerales bacterium]|nr:FliM/FliN family flagellar motor switch protein [Sedimentisphaerales bacterium]
MSQRSAEMLNAEKLKQLLEAVRSESLNDERQNAEAFDHDWRQPRHFGRKQLAELKTFAETVAAAASTAFTRFYQAPFKIAADSTSQHFLSDCIRQTADNFFLAFGAPDRTTEDIQPWGIVGIPKKTALAWTTKSLGQAGADENTERNLSQLESSLLLDIAALLVEAVAEAYGSNAVSAIGNIVAGQLPLDLQDTSELCKITFATENDDSQSDPDKAFLMMLCDKLEPVTKTAAQNPENTSPENASRTITKHLHRLPVLLTARLGSASITFADLMNLAPNDILLLDKKVNEPLTLIVDGLELFRGRPAKARGRYAVAITEPALANN